MKRWVVRVVLAIFAAVVGAIASAWVPVFVQSMSGGASNTSFTINRGPTGGTSGWWTDEHLAWGIHRSTVAWSNHIDVGKQPDAPQGVPVWAVRVPDSTVTTTTAYGWPWAVLRWAGNGILGGGGKFYTVNANLPVMGNSGRPPEPEYPARLRSEELSGTSLANQPFPPGADSSAPAFVRPSTGVTTSSVGIIAVGGRSNRPVFGNVSGVNGADILAPLRFTLFGRAIVLPIYPYWPGFTSMVAVWFAIAMGLMFVMVKIRRDHHNRVGQCLTCGYDRRGLSPHAPCPECGQLAASLVHPVPIVAPTITEVPPTP